VIDISWNAFWGEGLEVWKIVLVSILIEKRDGVQMPDSQTRLLLPCFLMRYASYDAHSWLNPGWW